MTRKFLEDMGLEKEVIDKILDENSADIGKEIAKATTARQELDTAKATLATAQEELETLKKNSGEAGEWQRQLEELQGRYDTDTQALQQQLHERDYTDAIRNAITGANDGKGLKFSSKSAERAFISALRERSLELKDGAISGFEDFVKEQQTADPEAFAPDKPAPRFAGRVGIGAAPPAGKSRAAEIAEQYNKDKYGTAKEEK